jgi:hypothetical protein
VWKRQEIQEVLHRASGRPSAVAEDAADPSAPAVVLVEETDSDRWTIELRNFAKFREALIGSQSFAGGGRWCDHGRLRT